jgi:septum formation inhibitor MinC
MADGDIHVYGTLKGRAVAGLGGSAGAHIFARAFDASLIGVYDSFVAPDACAELQKLQGKEVFVRLLQRNEIAAELRACGAEVVDCGGGNSLVVSPL